jgi:hypothetical protein
MFLSILAGEGGGGGPQVKYIIHVHRMTKTSASGEAELYSGI